MAEYNTVQNEQQKQQIDTHITQTPMPAGRRDVREMEPEHEERQQEQAREGYGFGDWFKSLFAKKIQFSFHGTEIRGKDGYRVTGGVVPLFDGVTLNLTTAAMHGQKEDANRSVVTSEPWGGRPVLTVEERDGNPRQEFEVTEMRMEAESDQVVAFQAKVDQPITYRGEEGQVRASSMDVREHFLRMNDAAWTKPDSREHEAMAVVDQRGLHVYEEMTDQEIQQEKARKQRLEELRALLQKRKDQRQAGQEQLEHFRNLEREAAEQKREDVPRVQEKAEEATEQVQQAREEYDKNQRTLNFSHENFEAIVNLENGDFELTFSHDPFEGEESETLKVLQDIARGEFKKYYDQYKDEAIAMYQNFGVAASAVEALLMRGEYPEKLGNEAEHAESEASGGIALNAEIPIVPGLSFDVSLIPEYSLGVIAKVKSAEVPRQEMFTGTFHGDPKDPGSVGLDIKKLPPLAHRITMSAGVTGRLSLKLRLGLAAGLGYLIALKGGVFAEGALQGELEDAENMFAKADLTFDLKHLPGESKPKFHMDGVDLQAKADLLGSVGADLSVESTLFNWEKELKSYTFKTWKIAGIEAGMKLAPREAVPHNFHELMKTGNWAAKDGFYKVDFLKYHIEGQQGYGLVLDQGKGVEIDRASGQAVETMQALEEAVAHLKKIQQTLREENGGNLYNPQRVDNYYKNLVTEMHSARAYLDAQMGSAVQQIEAITTQTTQLLDDWGWQVSSAKTLTPVEKHQERVEQLKRWRQENEENYTADGVFDEEKFNEAAYLHYRQEIRGGKGYQRNVQEEFQAEAVQSLSTKDRILAYEQETHKNVTAKHQERITRMEAYQAANPQMDAKKRDEGFIKEYKKTGAKAFFRQMEDIQDADALIAFEKKRMRDHRIMLQVRIDRLKKKKADGDTGAEFLRHYEKEMQGGELFAHATDAVFDRKHLETYLHEEMMSRSPELQKERMRGLYELYQAKHPGKVSSYDWIFEHLGRTHTPASKVSGDEKDATKAVKTVDRAMTKAAGSDGSWDSKARKMFQESDGKIHYSRSHKGGEDLFSVLTKEKALEYLREVRGKEYDVEAQHEKESRAKMKEIQTAWAEKASDRDIIDQLKLNTVVDYERSKGKGETYRKYHQAMLDANEKYRDNWTAWKTAHDTAKEDYFLKAHGGEKPMLKAIRDGSFISPQLASAHVKEGRWYRDADKKVKALEAFMGLSDGQEAGESRMDDVQVAAFLSDGGAMEGVDAGKMSQDYYDGGAMKYDLSSQYATVEHLLRHEIYQYRRNASSHYDRAKQLHDMTVQGKSDHEILEAFRSMDGLSDYHKYLQKQLDEQTKPKYTGEDAMIQPDDVIRYEEREMAYIESVYTERIRDMESARDKHTDFSRIKGAYRQSLGEFQSHFTKKHRETAVYARKWFAISSGDEKQSMESLDTPEQILAYEYERMENLGAVHQNRIHLLGQDDVTDDNIMERYGEIGGKEDYLNHINDEVNRIVQARMKSESSKWSYDRILAYEEKRQADYEAIREKVQEPLSKLHAAKAGLVEQLERSKQLMAEIEQYQPENDKDVFQNLGTHTKFVKTGEHAGLGMDAISKQLEARQKVIDEQEAAVSKEKLEGMKAQIDSGRMEE